MKLLVINLLGFGLILFISYLLWDYKIKPNKELLRLKKDEFSKVPLRSVLVETFKQLSLKEIVSLLVVTLILIAGSLYSFFD